MHSLVLPLLRHVDQGSEASIVQVVSLAGFGRRDAADGALVDRHGVHGNVLAGLLDPLINAAFESGRTRQVFSASVTDPDADAGGLLCGGTARLLLTPVSELPPLFRSSVESATPVALTTLMTSEGSTGTTMAVTREASEGTLSATGERDETVLHEARRLLATAKSDSTVIELGDDAVVIATLVPLPKGHVVGSGSMAEAIVAQGRLIGWEMSADETLSAGEQFITTAGPADAIVILSHDPTIDETLLDTALRSEIGYLGAMGSRNTQARRRAKLEALGHDPASFARIHGPVGLDLGSRTPAETAVAIVAEYLVNRSGRMAQSLAANDGPING